MPQGILRPLNPKLRRVNEGCGFCRQPPTAPVLQSRAKTDRQKETTLVNKEDVAAVLELIRPSLQADGGDVRLVDVNDEGIVSVELPGACNGCPLSSMTLANGIERILKERVPGVMHVVPAEPMM